jgi:hypothetical protein
LGLGTIVQRSTPVDVVDHAPLGLFLNYHTGQLGSTFTLTGENFPPGRPTTVTVNSRVLTDTLRTTETGGFIFFVNTPGAEAGGYRVTVSAGPSASAHFILDTHAPARPQEGGGVTLSVPAGIAVQFRFTYLPAIRR